MSSTRKVISDCECKRPEIFHVAARLFHEKGYAQTSMSDVANALGLTKAGLYHHILSKEHLLLGILNYGLDLLEKEVVVPLEEISDPEEKLRQLIRKHIQLILQKRFHEITVILHENRTLQGKPLAQINQRKKKYIHFLEGILTEIRKKDSHGDIQPKLGAFALLGMINWLYQWYDPLGPVSPDILAEQYTELFLRGFRTGTAGTSLCPF
jgi:TetR/AcrR family transcriptional regulator, cholesterol catabolism regulator